MKPIGKWYLILATALLLFGCGRIRNKVHEVKEQVKSGMAEIFDEGFYTSPGGRDYCRVPLIEPWELISTLEDSNGKEWHCGKREDSGTTLVPTPRRTVEMIGITDSTVYCRYSEALATDEHGFMNPSGDRNTGCYCIIDTRCDSVMSFDTEKPFREALRRLNVPNPLMHAVDSVYTEFVKKGALLFRSEAKGGKR